MRGEGGVKMFARDLALVTWDMRCDSVTSVTSVTCLHKIVTIVTTNTAPPSPVSSYHRLDLITAAKTGTKDKLERGLAARMAVICGLRPTHQNAKVKFIEFCVEKSSYSRV